jgi:ribosome maturation factor RimP
MRSLSALPGILALLPLSLAAQAPTQPKVPKDEYVEFSKLIHKVVVKQLPREFEDNSGWGQMTEVPANLPLAGLRKLVKVGDHLEAPHGTWRRFKGKIEEPDKNLKIVVKEFKKLDDKTYRVKVDVDATILCRGEVQQWQKGLMLIGGEASADANVTAAILCDVGVALNLKKFPPELNIEPKVTELGLELVDVKVRGGPILKGERGKAMADDLKDMLRAVVKASEPLVKEEANRAIAESLREGNGTISARSILQALPKAKK